MSWVIVFGMSFLVGGGTNSLDPGNVVSGVLFDCAAVMALGVLPFGLAMAWPAVQRKRWDVVAWIAVVWGPTGVIALLLLR